METHLREHHITTADIGKTIDVPVTQELVGRTNGDKTCPMPGGDVPDAGATITAFAHITGRMPELIAGKPSPVILQVALDRLGVPAHRCLMTGDRLETDMRMGQEAGMATALVLSGVTTAAEAAQLNPSPTFVLGDVSELMAALG